VGLRRLGLARRLLDPSRLDTDARFELLATVQASPGPGGPMESCLPLAGYRRVFDEGKGYRIDFRQQGPLGRWLRRQGGGLLVAWALPGDRLPWVAAVAWAPEGWDPGPLRLRVAQEGMEALARSLCPPLWWSQRGAAPPSPGRSGPKAWNREPEGEGSFPSGADGFPTEGVSLDRAREQLEATLIRRALRQTRGNKSGAARLLGLSRQGLYRKIQRLHLEEAGPGPRQVGKGSL